MIFIDYVIEFLGNISMSCCIRHKDIAVVRIKNENGFKARINRITDRLPTENIFIKILITSETDISHFVSESNFHELSVRHN